MLQAAEAIYRLMTCLLQLFMAPKLKLCPDTCKQCRPGRLSERRSRRQGEGRCGELGQMVVFIESTINK